MKQPFETAPNWDINTLAFHNETSAAGCVKAKFMLRITWSGMHAYMCACIYIYRQIYIKVMCRDDGASSGKDLRGAGKLMK